MLSLLYLSTLAALPAPAQASEHRLPDFDTDTIEATYVVSVPGTYDGARPYPLILDFHGAIHPSQKGATITADRVWSAFVDEVDCIVVGPNARTRGWDRTEGEHDDRAFALAALEEVRGAYAIDADRMYLAGFSSGGDYLCRGVLQETGLFAGSLVVCPGPPNVVGLRDGSLLGAKSRPFVFATGEEDYIRKDGSWQAFLALDAAGADVVYREVPRTEHEFPALDEYRWLFEQLERLAGHGDDRGDGDDGGDDRDDLAIAKAALARGDHLLASTHLLRLDTEEARTLLAEIEAEGRLLIAAAEAAAKTGGLGASHEAWWRIGTQFHRFDELAQRARAELEALHEHPGRDLLRARGDFFETRRRDALWTFDTYLDYEGLTERVRELADRYPDTARLQSMGKSVEGRDLWVLEITDRSTGEPEDKPAVYVQGAIHGNEISSMMVALYFAHQFAANPDDRRSIRKYAQRNTLYVAPSVNPDAAHRFVTEPHTHWRPRFNLSPHDADEDGVADEDGYEDLDGDGEIGQMYRPDPEGPYVLRDGRLVRGEGEARYSHVGREGLDDDGDGRYSEDPPGGVNLNRNFPVGFRARGDFEGHRGAHAASEPETRAIMAFVEAHPNIALFLDYHNEARCLFSWRPEPDAELYEGMAQRALERTGYVHRPLDHDGAGLTIAWSYGALGIPSFIVELETKEWDEATFVPAAAFAHPELGEILLGGDDKKLTKRNPPPAEIRWLAQRNWDWLRGELQRMPRLELRDPVLTRTALGYEVTGVVANAGEQPFDTTRARELGCAEEVQIAAEGAAIAVSRGESTTDGEPFRAVLTDCEESVTLVLRHPRGGAVRFPVARPRVDTVPIRRDYAVEEGYATPDQVESIELPEDNGPAFELKHEASELRIAVLLGEWADKRHRFEPELIRQAFFSDGEYTGHSPSGQPVYGSVRDFYAEMSSGRLTVTGDVFDWVELPGSYADYRDASFGSSIVSDRLLEALASEQSLEAYDGIVFIWAGNSVRRTSALWPMRIGLRAHPDKVAFKMGEQHHGEFAVGVACHEMGHTFGVNDKYGLGATKDPIEAWCLMGKGTHGGGDSGRHRPFHMCAWCKQVIGWVEPAVLRPTERTRLALRPVTYDPGECFRILLAEDGSEYLLLENRRREGFLTEFPEPGLVVFHVGPNDLPSAPQTRVRRQVDVGRRVTIGGVTLADIRLADDVVYLEVVP